MINTGTVALGDAAKSSAGLFRNTTSRNSQRMPLASTATQVEWLVDGAATDAAILAAVAGARRHVNLEYYIFEPDHAGTALRDALVERARAGVKVRLLLDAVGSSGIRRRFMQPLLDAGGEVAWFHPRQLLKPFKRPWLNLRTHRKLVLVDGTLAFTGGINITDAEDESRRADAYRDLAQRTGRSSMLLRAALLRLGLPVYQAFLKHKA